MTANQPPNIAVARLLEVSKKKPPTAAVAPGNTSSQPRAEVHAHVWPGVYAKWK
jgi:hypothetical protein